jgi:soluble lytic murein transglycosylase-like protein
MDPSKLTAIVLLLACWPFRCWADIYAYTADDGSVVLSNVPTDGRYVPLITAPVTQADPEPPAVADAPPPETGLAAKAGYEQIVDEASRDYGVDSALLHAVISVESRYNPRAVSKAGAVGMMQLMPRTARRYGVTNALDPIQNIRGGAQYLRDLLQMFNNNVSLALAAYNAGEQAVARHGNHIPPYPETRHYVPRVLNFYRRYKLRL